MGRFKKITVISAFLLPFIVLIMLIFGDFFSNKSYDFLTSRVGGANKTPHPDIMLILIDENAIAVGEEKFGLGRWPWKREIYAEILDYIHMTSNPKGVFFDILFSEGSSTIVQGEEILSDSAFQMAIYNYADIYHNVVFSFDNERTEIKPLPPDLKSVYSIPVQNSDRIGYKKKRMNEFTIPIGCLRLAVECGFPYDENETMTITKGLSVASFVPDSDGLHREGHILFDYHGDFFPSVSLAAIMSIQENMESSELPVVEVTGSQTLTVGKYTIPLDERGNYLINYYKDRIINYSYSMSALFESAYKISQGDDTDLKLHPDEFRNKIIIIGCSAVGCQDLKSTPVASRMPGPEIHATLISNILQGNHIIRTPFFIHGLMILFSMLLPLAIILYSRLQYIKIGIPILLALILGVASVFLFNSFNILIPFLTYITIGFISTGFGFGYQSIIEGKEKRKYSKILGHLVDPQIVKEALNDLESLKKGSVANITPFFSDIASFTTISEKLDPTELGALLNDYLSEMTIILKENQGTLDKYIGDAIVGIFGAPLPVENHPLKAANASLSMMRRIVDLRQKWKKDQMYCPEAWEMRFRIGLNTGSAKVGFMGTDELASYTMMGDTVNLAARLESAGKDYGVSILISETTYGHIKNKMFTRFLDSVRVKGKAHGIKIYELIDKKGSENPAIGEASTLYEKGFDYYLNRDWKNAIDYFKKAQKIYGGNDKASGMLIERCKWYQKHTPLDTWDGVFTRTTK
ncbi:MAG: CHASE2 domain-containing protein [Leptospirales bacterium]